MIVSKKVFIPDGICKECFEKSLYVPLRTPEGFIIVYMCHCVHSRLYVMVNYATMRMIRAHDMDEQKYASRVEDVKKDRDTDEMSDVPEWGPNDKPDYDESLAELMTAWIIFSKNHFLVPEVST